MFTGYVGLVYGNTYDYRTYTIISILSDTVEVAYKSHENEDVLYYPLKSKVESILNKQGKAPKRIQYEVYLNTFQKQIDNTTHKMDDKFYCLDKLVDKYPNLPYEPGDRLFHAPACKLPANYLPTNKQSGNYLEVVWNSPSTELPKNYWEFCEAINQCDTATNILYSDEPNAIIYSNNWIDCGEYVKSWFCNPQIWLDENLYTKAPCCVLPKAEEFFHPPQASVIDVQDIEYLDDGRIGLFEELEPTPLWGEAELDYQVITGSQYVVTYQLDITHYPILQPPNAGDCTVYNIFYPQQPNFLCWVDGYQEGGDGSYKVMYNQINTNALICGVKGICCKLTKYITG